MKIKKILSVLLCVCMAAAVCFMLTGCGDDESDGADGPQGAADTIVNYFFDQNAKDYFGCSREKLADEFGDVFKSEENTIRHEIKGVSSIANGNISLDGAHDVTVQFRVSSKGLKKVTYIINDADEPSSLRRKIADDIEKHVRSDMERKDYFFSNNSGMKIETDTKDNKVGIEFYVSLD